MDITKIHITKVKELTSLSNTLKSYIFLYKSSTEKLEQDFYRYSMGMLTTRVNELLDGDTKLSILYKGNLAARYSRILANNNEDLGLRDF